jgi:medium-chain acyl-[acyl-carrier-protein] hydrolase
VTASGQPPERWLAYRTINPRARMRMFCFPYAGGGASVYRTWGAALPADLEVCPVQIPGRESRMREKPYDHVAPMVDVLVEALRPYMDLPFTFFGHSMGAIIGFALARKLRRLGRPLPAHLFVSGRGAPDRPARQEPIHALPEAEFLAKLRELNGTPEEVLEHAELMQLLLPILRADFAVNETYPYTEEEPFEFGISAFGGLGDVDIPSEDVEAWKAQTKGRFRSRMLPGDHFFINTHKDLVLEAMSRDLAEISPAASPGSW